MFQLCQEVTIAIAMETLSQYCTAPIPQSIHLHGGFEKSCHGR